MRLNIFIARASGISRRQADAIISTGTVDINDQPASVGQAVGPNDTVTVNGKTLSMPDLTTIMLHKPPGFVCSRDGQGSKTIYDLLPARFHNLKSVGRLDKDSSGLLLLTNDGQLAQELTHPSHRKEKIYLVELNKPLSKESLLELQAGVQLDDGSSHLVIKPRHARTYEIHMQEGRKRQIRRTFEALGYRVTSLHRTQFGTYELGDLAAGTWQYTGAKSPMVASTEGVRVY